MHSRRTLLEKIGIAGTAGIGAVVASTGTAAAKPSVDWVPADSSNYTAANRGAAEIDSIVIHVAQGSAEGTVNWFANPDADVSAHYTIRDDGYKYQSLSDINIGWHAGNWDYNTESIGIEHGGYVSSGFTDAQYQSSAELVSWLCDQYNVPKSRVSGVATCGGGTSGIMGHHQVPDPSSCGYNDHTDPGSYWDWDYYMSLI